MYGPLWKPQRLKLLAAALDPMTSSIPAPVCTDPPGRSGHRWSGGCGGRPWPRLQMGTTVERPAVQLLEVLGRGAAAVFGCLLHQASHELADSQQPAGHTRESQRHDAVFHGTAETLGLEVEEDRPETNEWPITSVPETLAPRHAFTIHRLVTALTQWNALAVKLAMASCQYVPARHLLISPSSLTEG
jgi:hypothetical protein